MTLITPTQREERMKHEQQRAALLVTELAALIEQRNWPDVHDYCDAIVELTGGICTDAYHLSRTPL